MSKNITNPNSIYVKGTLRFKGYRQLDIHCYVDTGASLCIASKYIIPEKFWENAKFPLKVKIADNSTVKLSKVCRNLDIRIAGEVFHIPTVYQQESGIDFIIGNNFCQLYQPFIQFTDMIVFTKEGQSVFIGKVRKANRIGVPGLLESLKKNSKLPVPEPLNISTSKNYIFREGEIRIEEEEKLFLNNQEHFSKIEKLLIDVCSENPLDDKKTKKWMTAKIELLDPRKIVSVKPMQYSPSDVEEFRVQIEELLAMKIIRPSNSPHMSPAFLVNKEAEQRRGKKRMVVNYKAINEATVGDAHNLPNREELLARVRDKTIFSSFDCKSGFWQVLLDEPSQKLTAFTCPQGHYQWNVLPFGLKQAPAIFQRYMQTAFNSCSKYCTVYVDDILVFSENEKDHYKHVSIILSKCKLLGIILSHKKAQLFKESINFLGLEISKGTHTPQKHILEHIHKFPDRLEDKKQLQRFLGILTYASDYIPELAKKRQPLQLKLKADSRWNWTEQDTAYVAKIKKGLGNFPILYHPKIKDPLIIETDASHSYWGGILKARSENTELICKYTSGSFKKAELNYHSNDKEALAVIKTIKKFSIYLTPQKFVVRTDNKNFTYVCKGNIRGDVHQGRLVRWQSWLSRYDFDIEHISGDKNIFADFLTREYHQ